MLQLLLLVQENLSQCLFMIFMQLGQRLPVIVDFGLSTDFFDSKINGRGPQEKNKNGLHCKDADEQAPFCRRHFLLRFNDVPIPFFDPDERFALPSGCKTNKTSHYSTNPHGGCSTK